ncbi:MAG TPA: MFS transporter [Gammaproteobacteria bacterium]|jgi:MFS family permease|nr:MFS transporter [Gammaproteobacteria bacterium]
MSSAKISIKNVIAVIIGNALEWYDFVVYSFMTVVIAKIFFPSAHPANSILAATATFGVAFCLRPLGGIVLGIYSDKHGRKAAITLVIAIMTLAILMISTAPTYAQAGITAPLIIVIARMLQGFSAGGEFAVSTSLLIEMAPPAERGYYGSWQMAGQMTAMLMGAAVGMILTTHYTLQQFEEFAWRIPFMAGLIIAPIGFYLRNNLKETHVASVRETKKRNHFWSDMRAHWRQILIAMGIVVGGTVTTYVNISYLPTYAVIYLHMPLNDAFTALAIAVFMMILLIPFFGMLSDRIGRKSILFSSIFMYLILIYPLFYWLAASPGFLNLMMVELICCLLLAAFFGVFAAVVAELFPINIRSSGLGISYNLTVMLFGGFAQFIVTWLIETLQTPVAIAYYLMASVFISCVAAYFYEEDGRL